MRGKPATPEGSYMGRLKIEWSCDPGGVVY